MRKRVITLVIVAALAIVALPAVKTVSADNQTELSLNGRAAVLIEANGGRVLYEDSAEAHYPIASMVKIMTLNLAFEAIKSGRLHYSDMICVSDNAASMGGSQAFLDAGQSYKAENLIKSIIIASANDSCVAIAETLSGSVEAFTAEMNKKAKELGMNNTCFMNCTGLPAEGAYSCAADVAKMMRNLVVNYKDYFKFARIWMEDMVHPGGRVTGLTNTNRMIRFYDGCDGGKTGYTNEAKHCLCATAMRNGTRLISVVIGADDSKARFDSSAKLLNYGFANYETKLMFSETQSVGNVRVANGKTDTVELGVNKSLYIFGQRGGISGEVEFEYPDTVKAPLCQGDVIGKAYVKDNKGNVVDSADVVVKCNVEEATLWDRIKDIVVGK